MNMDIDFNIDEKIFVGENEKGFEFFLSEKLTKYAIDEGFKDMQVVYVKKKDAEDFESILLIQDNVPVYETKSMGGIATHLDILKIAKEF